MIGSRSGARRSPATARRIWPGLGITRTVAAVGSICPAASLAGAFLGDSTPSSLLTFATSSSIDRRSES
jgi:hypothetical protein